MKSGNASVAGQTARSDGRRTRWDGHREQRRSALVDAAVVAIRRHGAGVGMDEIAAAAGTSKAAVYRHFADKGDLYLAVCTRVADRLFGQLSAAIESEPEPRELLAAGIDAYLRIIEADPEVYRFVVHRPLPDRPVADDPITGLSTLVGHHVAGIIGPRLRAAGLGAEAAEPWGHGLVGLVRSAADQWLAGGSGMSREALRDHLTDLVWSGFSGILASAVPPDRTADHLNDQEGS